MLEASFGKLSSLIIDLGSSIILINDYIMKENDIQLCHYCLPLFKKVARLQE